MLCKPAAGFCNFLSYIDLAALLAFIVHSEFLTNYHKDFFQGSDVIIDLSDDAGEAALE
jgi:hypothetical protein